MNTITRRIITTLAGPAITAGVIAGGIALGAPAQASTQVGQNPTCVTTIVPGPTPDTLSPLTRAAQVNAAEHISRVFSPPTSCIGH